MPEKKEKKVSEAIIELETKVGLILKRINNIDLSNKLILQELRGRNRNLSQRKVSQPVSEPSAPAPTPAPTPVVNVSAPVVNPAPGKKANVDQKIVFASNGKNLSIAPVEIFDSKSNLIKRTRTNTAGRWSAQLVPGKYRIHILKIGSKNKVVADMQYIISVDLSTTTLPEVKIN